MNQANDTFGLARFYLEARFRRGLTAGDLELLAEVVVESIPLN